MAEKTSERLSDAEMEALRSRRFATIEEALKSSEEILKRFGRNREVMRRLNDTPINVPFEL
jgi:hypothetical protein